MVAAAIYDKNWGIRVVSPMSQFVNTYMPVTSGANVQNTFSFGSAVDERTRYKLYGIIKCLVHMFSALFGSAVHKRTRNNWYACKGKKWPCIL